MRDTVRANSHAMHSAPCLARFVVILVSVPSQHQEEYSGLSPRQAMLALCTSAHYIIDASAMMSHTLLSNLATVGEGVVTFD